MTFSARLETAKENWSQSIDALANNAHAILKAPHRNYALLQKTVKALDQKVTTAAESIIGALDGPSKAQKKEALNELSGFIQKKKHEIESHQQLLQNELDNHPAELKAHARWESLGHNPDFIETHPDFVDFFLSSGVAYQIAGFRNTSQNLHTRHAISKDEDGHPMVLFEGKMTRWDAIKERFTFLKEYDVLVSKNDPEERWTYTENGITNRDIYRYNEAFHIYTLPQEERAKLQLHAQDFFDDKNPDTTPNIPKDCVIQICTNVGVLCKDSNPLIKKVTKKLASHYRIRVITKEGKVYSFGYRRDVGERDFLQKSSTLGQVRGVVAMNDFDEFRAHDGCYVTTAPLSTDAANRILQELVRLNENVPAFDYFDENCVEITGRCMRIAGIEIDTKARLETCVRDIAYSFIKGIPILGKVVKQIKVIAKRVFNAIPPMPAPIKRTLRVVSHAVFFIPTKLFALVKNILVLCLGWTKVSPGLADVGKGRSFKVFRDLLDADYSNVAYPRKLLRWQKRQKTTHCHIYGGKPRLVIMPPQMQTCPAAA